MIQWSNIRFLGNSKLVKQNYIWIFLVPILFKLLSSSETPIQFININIFTVLPFSWTLLYYSALAFALGNLLYLIFCPQIIQRYSDYSEFRAAGYCMTHLNKFINELFNNGKSIRELLINKLTSLSDKTPPKEIDDGKTSVIEIKENDKAYNINNTFESDLFWYAYEKSDEIKKIPLILSNICFLAGFVCLAIIFLKNLALVISNV